MGNDQSSNQPPHRAQSLQPYRNKNSLPGSTKINGRFVIDKNIFPDYIDFINEGGLGLVFKWKWNLTDAASPPTTEELDLLLPVLQPNQEILNAPPFSQTQVTWLSHACCLVQWEGWSILCDPIFSERCAPVQWAGPRRLRPSPVQVADLPKIDVCVISHNHYDHLDECTMKALSAAQPETIFCVPLGMKAWFESVLGVAKAGAVIEMDWGEEVEINDENITTTTTTHSSKKEKDQEEKEKQKAQKRPPLTVVCVPCQHWCKRTITDTNCCLWSSWICKTSNHTYFFGGDTGYCGDIFKQTGELYPVDFAAIPIGAYGTATERWFHKPNHQNPEEAVQCHQDIKSRQSIGVHWGTFMLTGEPLLEPPQKLAAAVAAAGLKKDAFVCLGHGETIIYDLVRNGPRDVEVLKTEEEITL